MLLAKNINGDVVPPTRTPLVFCPYCWGKMQSKCGGRITHHWAHKIHDKSCIYKPETEWHRKWKKDAIEFGCSVEQRIGNNITDVVISKTRVLELQHSGISGEEIKNRCVAYSSHDKHTDWLFDLINKYNADTLQLRKADDGEYFTFVQKWKKSTINALFDDRGRASHGKVWFDFGVEGCVFFVKKLYDSGNGWGYVKPTFDVFYSVPQRWW